MSNDLVKRICQEWISDNRGDERFWEWWPGCPTEDDSLSAKKVFDCIEEAEKAIANMQREYDKRGERIRELEDELAGAINVAYGVSEAAGKRRGELEAKLAGAVEDFETIADTDPDDGTEWFHEAAYAAISKIKGEQP